MEAAIVDRIEAVLRKPQMSVGTDTHHPLALLPPGFTMADLEKFQKLPPHVAQEATVLTAADFVEYWKRFKTGNSVVFADERTAAYRAVIDYHSTDGKPAWGDHTLSFDAVQTPEWKTWLGTHRDGMSQSAFAEFIEENYIDVIAPSHADMIEISTSLQVHKDVRFKQATKLQTGTQALSYTEDVQGTAGNGQIKVPDRFRIKVPIFIGTQPVEIDALLRFRVDGAGKLVVFYVLHRHHKAVEAATQELTAIIRKGVGPDSGVFFLGAP
jgi:uncharacterized protein YfdQ (DUF2303 family)